MKREDYPGHSPRVGVAQEITVRTMRKLLKTGDISRSVMLGFDSFNRSWTGVSDLSLSSGVYFRTDFPHILIPGLFPERGRRRVCAT